MAVVAFTGTSTGNVYKVGQTYQSAGRTYTAQADGSFATKNSDGTVRSVVGSSQSSEATFYHSSSGGASGGGRPSVNTPSSVAVKGTPGRPSSAVPGKVGSGPGVQQVMSTPDGANMFASFFAEKGFPKGTTFVMRSDKTYDASEVEFPVVPGATLRTRLYYANGEPLWHDPRTSDVQDMQDRFGDDNPIISTVGAAYVGGTSLGVGYEQGMRAVGGAIKSAPVPELPASYADDPWSISGWVGK